MEMLFKVNIFFVKAPSAEQKLGAEGSAEKQWLKELWFRCGDNHFSQDHELELSRVKSMICSTNQRGVSVSIVKSVVCSTNQCGVSVSVVKSMVCSTNQRGVSGAESCAPGDFPAGQVLLQRGHKTSAELGKFPAGEGLVWAAVGCRASPASQPAHCSWRSWLVQQMVKCLVEPEPSPTAALGEITRGMMMMMTGTGLWDP